MKKAPKVRFPYHVKRGSVKVTIYRVANSGTASGQLFQVVWNVGGQRRRRSFSDFSAANDQATLQAELMAAGKVTVAQDIGAEDLQLLAEARRLCGDIPVLSALAEWQMARDACGGELLAAARLWRDTHAADVENVTAAEAVRRFLLSKQKAGVDTGASYENCLSRFNETFGSQPIAFLTARVLQTWLETIAHPVSRNTHRKRVVALFRWCRKQGLLPRMAETEAERTERAREVDREIGIIELGAWRRALGLVRAQHPEHLATLVIAGFAGLRRSELHSQRWGDIHLDRGVLRVTKAKRNTPSKRLVHLCPAAVEWLMQCERPDDPDELVAPPWSIDRIRKFCREAKPSIPCPENGFRHSFISYRVGWTGNVAETALEAGNGPAIVHKHYRELVSKSDGEAWFRVRPKDVEDVLADVIPLKAEA